MTDPLQSDRLLRKRNQSLQKQLNVTLQILSEEYRQCKDRMNKEERDCGKFLQSLYDTVPDLQSYEHPKTRSMNATALVRERLHSFQKHMSADTDDGSAAPGAHGRLQPPADSSHGRRPSLTSAKPEDKHQRTTNARNPAEKSSQNTNSRAESNVSGELGGSGPFRQVRQDSVRGKGVKIPSRPHTASGYRSLRIRDQDPKPDRPRTSFCFRKSSRPSLGKNAYSEHDQSVHELVLRRFQSIFDSQGKRDSQSVAYSVAVTPTRTHDDAATSDDQKSSSTDDGNDQGLKTPHDPLDVDASQVNGEHDCGSQKRHHCRRRVVWSARPHRKFASVSAPDIDALDIPSADADVVHGDAVRYNKPRSYSLSLPNRTVSKVHRHDLLEPSPVDPKIRALALQRNLVTNGDSNCHSENAQPDDKPAEHSPAHVQQKTIDHHHHHHHHQLQDQGKNARIPHVLTKSKSDTNVLKKQLTARTLAQGNTDTSPSSPQTTRRRHSAVNPASHQRRPSDATYALMNQDQLVEKLINAGRRSYITTTTPHLTHSKKAPGRSELSHRFVPVSRKTIVGILSEIENQKASTRTMLTTSKELQQFVKKLTPHDQLIEDADDGDSD